MENVIETVRRPHVIHNSGNEEWYTPPEIIEVARRVMGDIDLDPASSATANEIVRARRFYSHSDDGLNQPWYGRVWLNPPYSRVLIKRFSNLVVEKYLSGEIEEAMVLVNNATETRWCQNLMRNADGICFINGRLKFYDEKLIRADSPLQGQCLLYFGEHARKFIAECGSLGSVYFKPEQDPL